MIIDLSFGHFSGLLYYIVPESSLISALLKNYYGICSKVWLLTVRRML
jgi:hypothetical protein